MHKGINSAEFCPKSRGSGAFFCNSIFLRSLQNSGMSDEIVPSLKRILSDLVDRLKATGQISGPKDLAKKAGLGESTLRQAISTADGHTRSMTMENYIKLANYLGCSVAELIGEDGPRTDAEKILLRSYRDAISGNNGEFDISITASDLLLLETVKKMNDAQQRQLVAWLDVFLGPEGASQKE